MEKSSPFWKLKIVTDARQQDLVAARVLLHERRDVVHLRTAAARPPAPGTLDKTRSIGQTRKKTHALLLDLLDRIKLSTMEICIGVVGNEDQLLGK